MRRLALCALCLMAACTRFPELDAVVSDDVATADYPALAPLDPLLARGERAGASAADMTDASARAEGLRARGAVLGAGDTTDAEARAALGARAEALRARGAGLDASAGRDALDDAGTLAERRDGLVAVPPPDAAALAARRRALQEAAEALRAE
jgi:hypothetical protein